MEIICFIFLRELSWAFRPSWSSLEEMDRGYKFRFFFREIIIFRYKNPFIVDIFLGKQDFPVYHPFKVWKQAVACTDSTHRFPTSCTAILVSWWEKSKIAK